ncbi:MAG: hypothetical protein GEU71_09435 [Actinobacteria bacterium]|nr:hypothetical protein [Actinomycetota bacterium]
MAGKDLMTVHLGQFTRESASEIAGKLEEAEIAWWYKEPGFFSRIWEYGVRMFVDESRLEEAKGIAAEVVQRRAEAIEKRKGR